MNPNLKNRIPDNIFQNTTTSYKFFWCMSILELHKHTGKTIFDFDDIFARMVSEAWMILNRYQINLGGADHLKYSIKSQYDSAQEPFLQFKVFTKLLLRTITLINLSKKY